MMLNVRTPRSLCYDSRSNPNEEPDPQQQQLGRYLDGRKCRSRLLHMAADLDVQARVVVLEVDQNIRRPAHNYRRIDDFGSFGF